MSFAPRTPQSPASFESSGGRLVCTDGRALPLIGASLHADARGGLVRVTLEQTFRNPHDEPLRVTYSLPLPADGAVSGFAFRIGDERVVGQVDAKHKARERFENAILEGRTAALLAQERSSLFTQEVGNVPPRTQVVCEVQVDQRLTWLPDGAWEWRFPTVVAPRYLGAQGRVADSANVSVDVADAALPVKLSLSLSIRDGLADGVRPESPSHTLHSNREPERTEVNFGDERGASLDRDIVVRWRVATMEVGTSLDVSRPASGAISDAAYGLLTIVPPAAEAHMKPVPRDLIVLLDTSGSMGGSPLDQARRVTSALVDSLNDTDQLELIEFSNSPRRWKRGAVSATSANRRDAQAWLARLQASGGTEMKAGILEALNPLRAESQRQVILITDGLIGFEHEVLNAISQRLPKGSRVHTVGVGSGVNRSLTRPAAQAGRGVELVIGIGEDVEPFVKRLMARTNAPLLTDVELSGSALVKTAPTRIPDLFGGAPALVSVKLKPEGGELIVRSRSADGDVEDRINVPATNFGHGSAAVTTLFAREVAEELELAVATGTQKSEIDPQIEKLGIDFQISTRMTSWVAVSAKQTVDPRAPKRNETMPQEHAYGMSAEGLGLRSVSMPSAQSMPAPAPAMRSAAPMKSKKMELSRMRAEPAPEAMFDDSASEEAESTLERRQSTTGSFAPVREEAAQGEGGASKDRDEKADAPKAPGAPPLPPRAKESLVDMARRLFQRPAKGGGGAAPRRVKGKLRRAGKKLIVEIDVISTLVWTPSHEARLELSNGSFEKVNVETALTTANGTFEAGVTVTLVLEIDERLGEVATVHLSNGNEVLEIVL
ncbi:MAG: VIT domain-containing protein [Archangium sp.]